MAETAVSIGYTPHRFQAEIHAKATRFSVICTHRRFGKTFLSCGQLVDAAIRTTKQDARFGLLSPYLKQSRLVAWDYLKRFAGAVPGVVVLEGDLTIKFPNGASIALFGADNGDALRGLYFDGLVIDEVADLKADVWGSVIRPALSDRKGWCFFIGTPKGPDFFFTLYEWATSGFPVGGELVRDQEWSAAMYRVDETNLIDAKELASSQATMSSSQYRREFLCDFAASSDDVLITIDLVSQACARAITEIDVAGSPKILGVDVARFGDDRSVIQRRQGLAAFPPIVLQGVNNMDLAARVAAEINAWRPDAVFIDGGGVGGGVIDRLRQLGFDVIEVNFGGKPISDKFANKRTEMYNALAEWLKAGGCLPNDPSLKTDLCAPTYSFNSAGKMVLESKDDLKKRGHRSPDIADSLTLTFALPVRPKSTIYARNRHDNGDSYNPFAELYNSAGRNLGWSPSRRAAWSEN